VAATTTTSNNQQQHHFNQCIIPTSWISTAALGGGHAATFQRLGYNYYYNQPPSSLSLCSTICRQNWHEYVSTTTSHHKLLLFHHPQQQKLVTGIVRHEHSRVTT
jgi:hypothetical protein